jgi:RNA polymerase sigma-70 factor (family 1)
MDEFELRDHVRKLKASERDSFKTIVNHFHSGIFNFLVFKVNDRAKAEDLLQDTFIRLWENREALDEKLSIKSYLFTIANNLALNHIRHESIVWRFKQNPSLDRALPETPFEKLTQKELEGCIQNTIDKMSDKVRMVFLMCKVEGLPYREIAERLGLSVATVESHMVKALRMIREDLELYNSGK